MKIRILAVGKLKRGPMFELIDDYLKRMRWSVQLNEIDHSSKATESAQLANLIPVGETVIIMDERGESFSSQAFADYMEKLQLTGHTYLNFVIGGATGIDHEAFKGIQKKIAFGPQTWPHMLVRLMLVEQLYRAEQILAGHPYHKA